VPPCQRCCSPIKMDFNWEKFKVEGAPFWLLITVSDEVCDVAVKAEKNNNATKMNFVKLKRLYRSILFIFTIKILPQIEP
jgi:hypothetical protein